MNSMRPPKLEIALLQITNIFHKHAGSDQKIQKAELKKMLQLISELYNRTVRDTQHFDIIKSTLQKIMDNSKQLNKILKKDVFELVLISGDLLKRIR